MAGGFKAWRKGSQRRLDHDVRKTAVEAPFSLRLSCGKCHPFVHHHSELTLGPGFLCVAEA
jgi:hypothetical protein